MKWSAEVELRRGSGSWKRKRKRERKRRAEEEFIEGDGWGGSGGLEERKIDEKLNRKIQWAGKQ